MSKDNSTFIERLEIEHEELSDKYMALAVFLGSPEYNKVTEVQGALLVAQASTMNGYITILELRLSDLKKSPVS